MNQFTLLVVVLVAFCYFGGKYCPSALKKNKEMLLGVAGGLVLCSFFGLRLEGFVVDGHNFISMVDCYGNTDITTTTPFSTERKELCETSKVNDTEALRSSVCSIRAFSGLWDDGPGGVAEFEWVCGVGSCSEQAAREHTLEAADRRDQASHQGRWHKGD